MITIPAAKIINKDLNTVKSDERMKVNSREKIISQLTKPILKDRRNSKLSSKEVTITNESNYRATKKLDIIITNEEMPLGKESILGAY